jgi:hypothetical protein
MTLLVEWQGMPVRLSSLVPPGKVYVAEMPPGRGRAFERWLNGDGGGETVVLLNPLDRYQAPAPLVRHMSPSPGWTRHTLGQRELERDRRRAR